jgi:hypothetical protein
LTKFAVVGQSWSDTLKKGLIYSVKLKSDEGHTLTLKGDSSDIFKGYPKGSTVEVEIKNEQKTLETGLK